MRSPSHTPLPAMAVVAPAMAAASSSSSSSRHCRSSVLETVHHHLRFFLADADTPHAISRRCLALLSTAAHGPLDPALAGLCTAIEAVAGLLGAPPERIAAVEGMLQAPALLEEAGATCGVDNRFIVACAYFYLALVREMQGDRWQSAMDFLQAALVSPRVVRAELTPALWDALFAGERDEETARKTASKLRDSLIYYRVVSSTGGPSIKNRCPAAVVSDVGRYDRRCTPAAASSLASYLEPSVGKRKRVDKLIGEDHSRLQIESGVRCLQEMLDDSNSDAAAVSEEETLAEVVLRERRRSAKIMPVDTDSVDSKFSDSCQNRKLLTWCASLESEMIYAPECADGSLDGMSYSALDADSVEQRSVTPQCTKDGMSPECSPARELRCFSGISSKFGKKHCSNQLVPYGSLARKMSGGALSDGCSSYDRDIPQEFIDKFEKVVSTLHFSEGQQDADAEVTTIWDALNIRVRVKHNSVKQDILEQLFESIASSKKEVIRASVYILLLMISEDRNILKNIKRKELYLHSLATALKRNVHEAAILIYLLDPSPAEIKRLELLPSLLQVACSSDADEWPMLLPLTPISASIAMIELLVTAYDYVTNNVHLSAISSPNVLAKLVNVAKNNNLEEGIALAGILVRCVRLNGNCKRFLSQVTPIAPFIHLLRRKEHRARCAALQYFHEIIKIPRSSAIPLLQEILQQGGISIMHTLETCIDQAGPEHRLLAANLLLQLDMLENTSRKSSFREAGLEALVESVTSQTNATVQALAASLLANLGGTYSWAGEPYTAAYLLKKVGLTSVTHRNMVRNIEWLDPCLQDTEAGAWSARIARRVIRLGKPVFTALSRGMQSKSKCVSRDSLICSAWLGSEMATLGENARRYSACEVLIEDVARFLHPGSELDERVLACAGVYNYTSGKGKQKLMNFSESLRESLRRLSSVTWMAEELLRVTDYFLPSKPRVSCVHTQILEISSGSSVAVLSMVFFRGQLFAAYNDGTIRAYGIKGQKAALAWEVKEHKKAVTCLALFEPGDCLLSGSSDKSIRVWKMVHGKLECVDVFQMKDAILKLNTMGDKIVVFTKNNVIKLTYTSRTVKTVFKSRSIRDLAVAQGKAYLGCADFSVQEIDLVSDMKTEIRGPDKSWGIRRQPVNSVALYKDCLYCAGALIEGATTKDWRRRGGPSMSAAMPKGSDAQAMAVVEDFIYLTCSKNPGTLEIWLRGKQQKVGRLSGGSKITALLTANDAVYCGTEAGLIKAWIPL